LTATLYDFEMPKIIDVQMVGIESPAHVQADKAEVNDNRLILTLGSEKVGDFLKSSVVGWWVQKTDQK
jgi:hypothetical protein